MTITARGQKTTHRAPARRRRLRNHAIFMSLALIVQFFLGMINNLYVSIPDQHPGANAHNYFAGGASSLAWVLSVGSSTWLAAHAALGCLLVLVGIECIVLAARSRSALWIWSMSCGAAFIIGAAFNGISFLVFNKDFSSLIMAGLCGLAIASYVLGLYLDDRRAEAARAPQSVLGSSACASRDRVTWRYQAP